MASGDDVFRAQGTVLATLRNASFKVKLDSGHEVTARASGKMRRGRLIRIIPGDRVELEVSAYDPTKAHWRNPMDMIRQGWSMMQFQASQAASRTSW